MVEACAYVKNIHAYRATKALIMKYDSLDVLPLLIAGQVYTQDQADCVEALAQRYSKVSDLMIASCL